MCRCRAQTRSKGARRRSATTGACASRPYDEAAPGPPGPSSTAAASDEGVRVYCYFKHEDEPDRPPLYAERLARASPSAYLREDKERMLVDREPSAHPPSSVRSPPSGGGRGLVPVAPRARTVRRTGIPKPAKTVPPKRFERPFVPRAEGVAPCHSPPGKHPRDDDAPQLLRACQPVQ